MPRPTAADLASAQVVWILTIEWRGREYRRSTIPIEITDADGVTHAYQGGLGDISGLEESLSSASVNGGSVPLEIDFEEDLITVYADGYRLSSATGSLDMVTTRDRATSVQTWEGRYRYLTGRVVLPRISARGDRPGLASFSLEQSITQDRGRILPASAVITGVTYPNAPEKSVGKVYPLVMGRQGSYPSGGVTFDTLGSPAYVVEETGSNADTLHLGYGHWTATQAKIIADSTKTSALTLIKTHDATGQAVTEVDISGQSSAIRTASAYYSSISSGEGYRLPFSGTDHRGAGDWIRFMLSRSTLTIDNDAWSAVTPALNGYKIASFINDPDVTPSEWLIDNVLGLFPLDVLMGPEGLTPVLDELEVPPIGARPINESADFRRVGPLQERTDPADLVESYTLRFAKNVGANDFKLQITIAADPAPGGRRSLSTLNAKQSGALASMVEETDVLSDPGSGDGLARYRAKKLSQQPVWDLFSAVNHYGNISVGDHVSLTWGEKGIADVVFRVEGKRRVRGRWVFLAMFPYGLRGLVR